MMACETVKSVERQKEDTEELEHHPNVLEKQPHSMTRSNRQHQMILVKSIREDAELCDTLIGSVVNFSL